MDIKDTFKLMDDMNIDEIELGDVELNADEKERALNYTKKITKRSKKKKMALVAGLTCAIVIGTVSIPAVAEKIPFINQLYKDLGIFDNFEDYTSYIGLTKEENGYKVTVDNIVATENRLKVAIMVESEKELSMNAKKDNFSANASMSVEGVKSSSGGATPYYIDSKKVLLVYEEKIDGKYNKLGNLSLNVSKTSEDFEFEELSLGFDLKIDFSKAFDETKIYTVNKDVTDKCRISSIETTIMGTDINFSADSTEDNIEYARIRKFETGAKFYLEVDGVLHSYGRARPYDVHTLTSKGYKEAKDVNLIVVINKDENIDKGNQEQNIGKEVEVNNVVYPEYINSPSGKKGKVERVEWENDNLKIYFNSEYNELAVLQDFNLTAALKGGYFRADEGLIAKEDGYDGYVITYKDVPRGSKVKLNYFGSQTQIDNYNDVKTVKIK